METVEYIITNYGQGQYFLLYNHEVTDVPYLGNSGIINLMINNPNYYIIMAYPFNCEKIYKKYRAGNTISKWITI